MPPEDLLRVTPAEGHPWPVGVVDCEAREAAPKRQGGLRSAVSLVAAVAVLDECPNGRVDARPALRIQAG